MTINVPRDVLPGKRYAVVWAEVSTNGSREARMYASIGPSGSSPSNFEIVSLRAGRSKSGQPLVVARIHNNGRRVSAAN